MTIVRHPTLDVAYDMPASRIDEWLKSGWLADATIGEIKTWDGLVIATDAGQLAPTKPKPKPKK